MEINSADQPELDTPNKELRDSQTTQVPAIRRYKVRTGTTDAGKDYEYKIAASLFLKCILQGTEEIEDMWMVSNAHGVGDFDDVVLHLKKTNCEGTTYMLQLKHKQDPNNIQENELISPTGALALTKYFKDIEKLKKSIASDHDDKPEIITNLGSFKNIHFVLFSNRKINDIDFLQKHDNSSFLNTNEKASIYELNHSQLPNIFYNKVHTENFYIFPNQIGVDALCEQIEKQMENISEFALSKHLREVAKEYIDYVTLWAKGKLGGHFYLQSDDILYKLTELLLRPYMVTLSRSPNFTSRTTIWNESIASHVVTMVGHTETSLNFLNDFIKQEIQDCCGDVVENWEKPLSGEKKDLLYKTRSDLKGYLIKSVGNHGVIYPVDIYRSMWRAKKLPLLLEISDSSDYNYISDVLKFSQFSFGVIMLYKNSLPPPDKCLKRFETLENLRGEQQQKVLKQTVSLQGKPGALLADLVQEDALQYVTSDDVLSILADSFNIGEDLPKLPENFISRTIRKTVLRPEVLQESNAEIFLIKGKYETLPVRFRKICIITEIDLEYLNKTKHAVCIERNLESHELEKLKSAKRTVHILSMYDERCFNLEWSSKFTKVIDRYKTKREYLLSKETIDKFLNTATILEATPGMGKTILMDHIASLVPVNYWVLRVDLNRHQKYFRSQNSKPSATQAEAHLHRFHGSSKFKLTESVFKSFVRCKKVVLLLDGFDEIAFSCKKQVTNVAASIHLAGYPICITTRPLQKEHLEELFHSTSDTIKAFEESDKQRFLTEFFDKRYKDLNVDDKSRSIGRFAMGLLEATSKNLKDKDSEFTGIPLQLTLLAEVFSGSCEKCILKKGVVDFEQDFNLVFLYEQFVANKIDIYVEKHGDYADGVYEQSLKNHQAMFALKLIFPEELLNDFTNKLYLDYVEDESKRQQLEHVGLVSLDERFNIICVHRTVAEYLCAKWLVEEGCAEEGCSEEAENRKLAITLIRERFSEGYEFVFYIFDKLASQDCPLHLAILDEDYDEALDNVNETTVNQTDEAGRTPLHVVAINSPESPRADQDRTIVAREILSLATGPTQKDKIGYEALDYALITSSLATANEIQVKVKATIVNACISLDLKLNYLLDCIEHYPALFELLLPYFISRDLLLNNIQATTTLESYTNQMRCFAEMTAFLTKCKCTEALQLLQSELANSHSGYKNGFYKDLRYAVSFGSDQNVQQLLNQHVDINEQDVDGNTALHYAVLQRRQAIFRLLISKGAKTYTKNILGDTPLHTAGRILDFEAIHYFINKTDVNISNRTKSTILHLVLKNGDFVRDEQNYAKIAALIQWLAAAGGDINAKDAEGNTPLRLVSKLGCTNLVDLIINNGGKPDLKNNEDNTPLHLAIMEHYQPVAKLIIAKGADVNESNQGGNTPLHLTLTLGYDDISDEIITRGGDTNIKNNNDDTALHVACRKGALDMVNSIIENRGLTNQKNRDGETPLHLALLSKHPNVAELIIKKGGALNVGNKKGNTPLHLAVKAGYEDIAQLIIIIGANFNYKNREGDTPLHLALARNQQITIKRMIWKNPKILETGDFDGNTALHLAASSGYQEIVRLILSKDRNVHRENKYGDTPLHLAAKDGHRVVVQLLIAKGGNVNARNRCDETPLHLTASYNHLDVVELILSKGGEVNAQDYDGNTALHFAVLNKNPDMKRALQEKGGDLNLRNNEGSSVRDLLRNQYS